MAGAPEETMVWGAIPEASLETAVDLVEETLRLDREVAEYRVVVVALPEVLELMVEVVPAEEAEGAERV